VIDERMDLQLVSELAQRQPDMHFVFVGPVVKIDPDTLPRRSNVHWLGFKSYADLPNYLRGWDAGFMPFALNESTRFISPTKTPEFLAAGLPLCSTAIVDVVTPYRQLNLVTIAADAAAFSSALETLVGPRDPQWLQAVDRYLRHLSWDRTWKAMDDLIRDAEARQSRSAAARRRSSASQARLRAARV
jgi:hypothetical protein